MVTLWWAHIGTISMSFFHMRKVIFMHSVPKTELLEVGGKGRTANNDKKLSKPKLPTWCQRRIHTTLQKKSINPQSSLSGHPGRNSFIALVSWWNAESLSRHTTADLKGRDALLCEGAAFLYSIAAPATANLQCFRRRPTLENYLLKVSVWNPEPGRPDTFLKKVIL